MNVRIGLPEASRAVLIGVYGYQSLEDLPAVARNVIGLHGVLTDRDLWGSGRTCTASELVAAVLICGLGARSGRGRIAGCVYASAVSDLD